MSTGRLCKAGEHVVGPTPACGGKRSDPGGWGSTSRRTFHYCGLHAAIARRHGPASPVSPGTGTCPRDVGQQDPCPCGPPGNPGG
jgi:hypothetical protein